MKPKPRYWWDRKRLCYVDYDTGEPVDPRKVRAWVLALILASRAKLMDLGRALQTGAISKAEWQALTTGEIKKLHTTAAVLAAGGDQNLSPDVLDKLEEREAFQFEKLNEFAADVPENVIERDGTIAARAGMYAMAAVATFVNIERMGVLDRIGQLTGAGGILGIDVEVIEQRVLGSHAPCDDCEAYAAMGWQPYGTLPELGDSICLSNCQCEFEYRVEGSMRDEDFDPAEIPLILQLPKAGNYVIDPSAMPLGQPARVSR